MRAKTSLYRKNAPSYPNHLQNIDNNKRSPIAEDFKKCQLLIFVFFVPHHVSPHLNSANDIGKKLQKISVARRKEHKRKQTTGSLNDCFPGRAASPFFTSAIHRFHVAYCVFYIFFIYQPPLPSPMMSLGQIDIRWIRIYGIQFLTVLFICDFAWVNMQVVVFNFEMNVYCRVSVFISMVYFGVHCRCRYIWIYICTGKMSGFGIDCLFPLSRYLINKTICLTCDLSHAFVFIGRQRNANNNNSFSL